MPFLLRNLYIAMYLQIHAERIITTQWRRATQFLEKYTSHFIWKVCVWEGVGDRTELQHIDLPSPSGHSRVSFSFSWTAQPGAWGPSLSGTCYHPSIFSPTGLQTNWLPVFTELCNSSIAHSVSLEWHVWSSSSGNNCHAVHRSLSSGASVCECTAGFYLVPCCQPSPPTRFLPITTIRMCHFLPVHHFGMACLAWSKVNI